jgi:hypothetical protein
MRGLVAVSYFRIASARNGSWDSYRYGSTELQRIRICRSVRCRGATGPRRSPTGWWRERLWWRRAFTAPIDTDTAAAGDVVVAKVRKAVRDPRSKGMLIPAGVTVHGRIIEMRHWLAAPAYFLIAILLETVDIDGVSSPFYAQLDRPDEYMDEQRTKSGFHPPGVAIILPPAGRSTSVGSFVFRTTNRRYVVPSNYESNWTTIPTPNQGTPPSR